MYQGKTVGALLLMGGEGGRFASPTPKQFVMLQGKPLYTHALETLQATGYFDEILLVCHLDWLDTLTERAVAGGKTRQESAFRGLLHLKSEIILIHDAVRPFVSERIIRENLEGAIQHGAVDTCIPSADTLVHAPGGKVISSIPKRAEYMRGQTPQTFRKEWIVAAHKEALDHGIENASDDCQLILRMGHPVHIVLGDEKNLKITSPLDLMIAEHIQIPV